MITGIFGLDWALLSISLFNAMLMLWLGLTVMLTAERRTWGVWVMEEGLLLGALFFIVHTIILGFEHTQFWQSRDLNFWWRLGWMPVILAPLAWYVAILWYSSFFDSHDSPLFRRHLPFVVLAVLIGGLILVLIAVTRPMPTYLQMINFDLSDTINVNGIPILFLLYPPYALLCIIMPIDALLRPEPSHRMMGEIARRRSRPWLLATSAMLLGVIVVVSLFLLVIAVYATSGLYGSGALISEINARSGFSTQGIVILSAFDLLLSALIAIAITLLGQAVVTYEVFTGTTLPRRGFLRHWRNTILLSVTVSIFVGWSLVWQPLPVYSLLIMAGVIIVFYAVMSWRSFVQREQLISRLRPFVTVTGSIQPVNSDDRAHQFFTIICEDMLGAERAYLTPMGAFAPVIDTPLAYPPRTTAPDVALSPSLFSDTLTDKHTVPIKLDPTQYSGFQWAVPLWSERGLSGVLLLGNKREGGVYTQEEIDFARAGSERVVEVLASDRMTNRLMALQRARLSETRVMDLHTRRALHDDILPVIHTAILHLSAGKNADTSAVIADLTQVHGAISDLIHTTPNLQHDTNIGGDWVVALRRMVQTEFSDQFTAMTWELPDTAPIPLAPMVRDIIMGAIREVVRNAAVHGRGQHNNRPLSLCVGVDTGDDALLLQVRDDGVGLSASASTAKASGGAGRGLGLHSTLLAIIGGYLALNNAPQGGTIATITIPKEALTGDAFYTSDPER